MLHFSLLLVLLRSIVTANDGYLQSDYDAFLASGSKGGVATEAPACSEVGVELLRRGGSAVDAAIGATLCQGVVYPFASGIGGGGFMLIKKPGETRGTFIDFRETAPGLAHQDMFSNNQTSSSFGGLAIGVPGELRGLEAAHKLYGKLSWKEVFEPAIKLAKGHLVPYQLPLRLERRKELVNKSPSLLKQYTRDGKFVKEGDQIKLKELAETLEIVANKGADAFYNGPIAEKLVKTIKENGGIITLQDFKDYKVNVTQALSGTYLNQTIHFLPSPASGTVVYHILKIIESFPQARFLSPEVAHYIIEAFKFGFAGRAQLGDPHFVDVNRVTKQLTDLDNIKNNIKLIDHEETKEPKYYYKNFDSLVEGNDPKGTSHVNTIDSTGLAVSVTSTINLEFGSKVLSSETGVLLNCQMDDFSSPGLVNLFGLKPSPSNYIVPNKRPLSSMSPIIIEDPTSILAVGGSGGSRIITSVSQVLYNYLHLRHPLPTSINLGRLHHQLEPNEIRIESNKFSPSLLTSLQSKGHTRVNITIPEASISIVHATLPKISNQATTATAHQTGAWNFLAVSDKRKSGQASAY